MNNSNVHDLVTFDFGKVDRLDQFRQVVDTQIRKVETRAENVLVVSIVTVLVQQIFGFLAYFEIDQVTREQL